MPISAAAALAGKKAAGEVIRIMDTPVIGTRTTRHYKNKTVTNSFELNGWHLAVGGAAALAFIGAGIATGILRWNKQKYRVPVQKLKGYEPIYEYKQIAVTNWGVTTYKTIKTQVGTKPIYETVYEDRYFYLPGANPDKVEGGDGWINKALAGSAPNYIFGGGPAGVIASLWP